MQQERFLGHVADHPAPLPEMNLLQWHIVNQNFALLWTEQADNQIGDRGFSCSRRPHDSSERTRRDGQRRIPKHRCFAIAETDIV